MLEGRYCKRCLYDLRGIRAVDAGRATCPECGREFVPSDDRTTLRSRRKRWRQWVLEPPRLLGVLIVAFGTWVLWRAADFDDVHVLLAIIFGLPAFFVVYVFRAAAFGIARGPKVGWTPEARREGLRHSQRFWWCLPFAVVVVVGTLLMFSVPFRVVFAFSQSSMEQHARQLLAQPSAATQFAPNSLGGTHRRFGLIDVDSVEIEAGRVIFYTGGFFFSHTGIMYAPSGPPPATQGGDGVLMVGRQITSDWYLVSRTW